MGTAVVAGVAAAGCSSSGSGSASKNAAGRKSSPTAGSTVPPATTADADACRLTPEVTAGPYYLDGAAVRHDITESKPGFALDVAFTVIDSQTCSPLARAAVDIWHCDAHGEYSGWNGNTLAETFSQPRNHKTYLRGIQLTGDDGTARFRTIYPGWYEGRAIHIHLKVHTDGRASGTYTGGHVAHVGQVFFDDTLSDRLMALEPYGSHTGTRTRNAEDSIYREAGSPRILSMKPKSSGDPHAGFVGHITLAVDSDATPKPKPLA